MSRKRTEMVASEASTRLETLDADGDIAQNFCSELFDIIPDSDGAYHFKWTYLRQEIMSKYCRPNPEEDLLRVDRAVEKLLESEAHCAKLNKEGFSHPDWPAISFTAQRYIAQCLGDVDEVFSSYEDKYQFPSGATTCFKRRQGDSYFRFHENKTSDVTSSAFRYATYLRHTTPRWSRTKYNIVSGNAVFTVPKATDIDRCACKEPGMNQVLQRTVGSYIRTRLRRGFGIDLNDQSRNRSLARRGSSTGRLATLDLSAASDSISCRLVDELLPPRWSAYLNQIRSPFGVLPNGKLISWEKHSTMGNGYTFELESLIFYALLRAAIDIARLKRDKTTRFNQRLVSVYGDDIIIPSHYYDNVVQCLGAAGFKVNDKKSFSSGPFRESCGGHYYNGHNVKPFYIRKPINSLSRLIWLLNALRAWAADDDGWCDPSVYHIWKRWRRKYVPSAFLGGKDVNSITEVASPEAPRWSHVPKPVNRSIQGYPAILRWFSLSLADRPQYGNGGDSSLDKLTISPRMVLYRAKRYRPHHQELPLFPDEAVNSTYPLVGYADYLSS